MMRAVLFLVVALCGRVRSQTDCEPFNTDPATGAPIASAMVTCQASGPGGMTSVQPADRAPEGTVCMVDCAADTFPPAAGATTYTCIRQPASVMQNGCTEMFMWVSQLDGNVPITCSAAQCPTFRTFADSSPGAEGVAEFSCTAADFSSVDDTTTTPGHVCQVSACAAGYTLSSTAADLNFTCTAGMTTAAMWIPGGASPCTAVTCPRFDMELSGAQSGQGPLVNDAMVESCTGVSTDGSAPSRVGDTCAVRCSMSGQGLTNTGDFTCVQNNPTDTAGVWMPPDGALPGCLPSQCPDFANADISALSENAVRVDCTNTAFGQTCEAMCGPNEILSGGVAGNGMFTCSEDPNRSNVGVWQTSTMCVADVMCPRLNETVAMIDAEATMCGTSSNATEMQPVGTVCMLACATGFAPPNPNDIQYQCDTTGDTPPMGQWSTGPSCSPVCAAPNAMVGDGGFDADNFANGMITCRYASAMDTDPPAPLNEPGREGMVCTPTCGEQFGFANDNQRTITCTAGAWTAEAMRPQCTAVQCPPFNTVMVDNAGRSDCNDPAVDECTFSQPIDGVAARGVSCRVSCMNDFVPANEKNQVYTCATPMSGLAEGIWSGNAVCNRVCSEAQITSLDGTYEADCCARLMGGGGSSSCMLGDGGCATNEECGGPSICGVAGQSCSPMINMVDANARCCVDPPCPDFMPWAMANLPGVNFTAGDTSSCTEMANVGSVCTVTCREGYELEDSTMAALTCMARGGMTPMPPMWDGGAPVCRQAATTEPAPPCSPASIAGPDATWEAGCCANLADNATCAAGYGGCAENDQCTGDLICGVAGESCSEAIETAAGDMANMTRCCFMEPPPPCSPASITGMGGAWEAGCCASLPNNGTCASGYGGCADDDECTGELRCGVAGESCSAAIEEAAGDSRNATRCCVTGPTDPPANTEDPSMQAASHLETQFVTVLVAVTSVITFVFVAE